MPNALQDDADADLLAAASPRHLDLARSLMQDIRSGRTVVGELLPTEAELCATWGLSRYAVRQALQRLCALGLVTRQAGVGTRVVSDRLQTKYVQSMDGLSDLARYAKGTTLHMMTRERWSADEAQAQLLRCDVGAKWLHLRGVRSGIGETSEPIALVDIYVDAAFSQLPGLAKNLDVPVYTLIEERYGIKVTRVEQELRGILIDAAAAEALCVVPGSPGLQIIRTYFVRDKVIEVTTGVHPASRFSYSMSFQLAQAAG
ncbi:MAG: GntR family transcriptional regulator [Cupriavidus necator]